MKRKIFSIICLLLICILSTNCIALAGNGNIEDNNDFMEDEYHVEGTPNLSRWSYTNSTTEGLTISSNGTATMSSSVIGYSNVTKIEIYFYLQQYDGAWKNVKTYKDTVYNTYAAKEHVYSGLSKGYKYRLRCTYYVYSGNKYDYFMEYTDEKYY